MKKMIITWCVTFVVGGIWHFLYDWIPILPVALLAPINESVWEHLKLLYFPVLAVEGVRMYRNGSVRRLGGIAAALLVMPFFILGWYYILLSGFEVYGLTLDIVLYGLSLGLGQGIMWLWEKHGNPPGGILVALASIYGVALILLTFSVPDLPIFWLP